MSFKKAIVSSVAAAAIATSAFAGTTSPMAVAADKTGDYLLFPAYYANSDGWKTDLRVVNTNLTHSVVAKVVIRDAKQSAEKVDFLIYLTPGDVWSGLIYETAGTVHISSSDDSLVIGGVPANETPVDLVFPAAVNGQVITSGYVEVLGLATSSDLVTYTDANGVTKTHALGNAPVPKRALYQAFTANYDDYNWTEVTDTDMTGQAVVYADNTNGQLAMTYTATAFEGFMGDFVPANQAAVAANIIGQDTKLSTHVVPGNSVQTSVCKIINEMENALDKTASYVIHYGDTTIDESALLATFVTKKYRKDEGATGGCPIGEIFNAKTTPEYSYTQSSDFYVTYTASGRDMEENDGSFDPCAANPTDCEISGLPEGDTPDPEDCDRELCQISVANSVGAQGYVTYAFYGEDDTNDSTAVVNPMPYDSKVMTAKNVGGANVTNMISPAYVAPAN